MSQWQDRVDWEVLYEAGVRFAVVKVSQGDYFSDPRRVEHVAGALAVGMVVGVYHWHDPNCAVESQLNRFEKSCEGLDFHFAAGDVEQYWKYWKEWQARDIRTIFSGRKISETSERLAAGMVDLIKRPVVVYTRASFVKDYAPAMSAWLPAWDTWLAHYPYRPGRVSTGWANLKNHLLPTITGPALPAGCNEWTFWQFSGDKFVLPGVSTALDLNFYRGSENHLRGWAGLPVEVIDEEPDLETKIRLLWESHPELQGRKVMA